MGPFSDEQFLGVYWRVLRASAWASQSDGVEDPVVSAIFRHDVLLQGRAARCLTNEGAAQGFE